ncbi:hypothetical protein SpiGrapes_3110 [Sphaerochaeta pleomorpha str. Grapes]|uniref:PLP-dependent enzyme possibly involved in cell wall biogenesis n=1 Tax=Sphaerochaeta pleomorpha (strain ATCC BAA-1885 / DSM 22778 / Grapes) TaxID=158190 RepID=G8QYZ8_SPHPG|nr:hypothetical protein [Sphaerochaeta pleomorpha]AEV30857.1 hypothetical protein SpiGrapes_3110 [Sphaerochaeta pleomorpha str. Grapes]
MTSRIGGMFCMERISKGSNTFLENKGDDVRFYMSGRCALYACLCEIRTLDTKKIAYVPAYTCETVLASYEKAGYSLRFYDVDEYLLTPLFKDTDLQGVSVLGLSAYYGFSSYSRSILQKCRQMGITILQDITHSPFSLDGYCPEADFYAGSIRKWMGIACGGVAIKREGKFEIPIDPPDQDHLKGRYEAMAFRAKALLTKDSCYDQKAYEVFWKTEMQLRQSFAKQGSDERSAEILNHFNAEGLVAIRRRNYQTVLDTLKESKQCRAVFPVLGENSCPSHFCFYSEDRERAQRQLEEMGIKSTVYWPLPPQLKNLEAFPHSLYIYDHIVSVQIDQRYGVTDMEYLGKSLSQLT